MEYTVWYKKVGSCIWKKLSRVKGDGIMQEMGHRAFILFDESRVEIPVGGMMFKFSAERFLSIKKTAELEAGQPIVTR